ncbi:serine/threonine-protein kinase [Streptomyces sp. B6B3]|uniref:serine/threonine-protein kinase n=1 Tax=Streptomyces sp. B6B3 TaxID=3153570 RepID=UPI00325CE9B1
MLPGHRIADRYTLLRVIGKGRSGEVWLALDESSDLEVALKPCRIEGDGAGIERLPGEARAMEKFRDHPHVVDYLHDPVPMALADGRGWWLVMEFLPDGSLDGRSGMEPRLAARYGAQIAAALEALHAEHLVHCDVKPANIGVAENGHAKLFDFSAAYRMRLDQTVSRNGQTTFTPCYAPAELASGGVPAPRSDVYCLGATLQELVTGRPPCAMCEEHETVSPHQGDRLGPLREVVAALLQERAGDRPTAAETRSWLATVAETGQAPPEVLRDPPYGPERSAPPTPGRRTVPSPGNAGPRPRPRRRRRVVVAGGAAVVVLSGLGATWAWDWSRDDADPSPYLSPSPFIGDERTVDPCVLTDEEVLSRFGDTRLDRDYGYFARCDVLVNPGEDAEVDVQVILADGPEAETMEVVATVGDVTVLGTESEEDECQRVVVPPGGDDVSVEIVAEGADGEAALCAMADAAARSAAEVLETADGPLRRRSPEPPDESLVWQDACTVVDQETLAAADLVAAEADDNFGGWSCSWPAPNDGWAEVDFNRELPVTAEDGELIRLSGHDAALAVEGYGPDTCLVTLEHREIDNEDGGELAEVLQIAVGGSEPMDDLCADATDLAASAAAALPTA